MKLRWKTIRRVWIVSGLTFTVVFNVWMLLGRRAQGFDQKSVLRSDSQVHVFEDGEDLVFEPVGQSGRAGFLFYPGGLVDPDAYAPTMRALAEKGHKAVIVRLPFRSALLDSQEKALFERTRRRIEGEPSRRWVLGGHSRGGALACRFAAGNDNLLGALVLIGTSHPVGLDLSGMPFPVVKIYATKDGVAPVAKVEANRRNLPAKTRWVRIEGGNHAQFGWYGHQFDDNPATISREKQQAFTIEAILEALQLSDIQNAG